MKKTKRILAAALVAALILSSTATSVLASVGYYAGGYKFLSTDLISNRTLLTELNGLIKGDLSNLILDVDGNKANYGNFMNFTRQNSGKVTIDQFTNYAKANPATIPPGTKIKHADGTLEDDPEAAPAELKVESVSAIDAITVDNGTTADKLGLPATVGVTLSDGTTDNANVTWDTTAFDGTKAGDVTINGTLSVPAGKTWTLTDAQKSVSVKVTVKEAVLTVQSVSAINLREVTVAFSGKVDKTTAETAANYTADNGITFSNPKLSDDGTTVTLWASANLSTTADTNVTVKNVKDAAGSQTVTTTTKAIRGSDTAIPTVQRVEALGASTLVITFSEPVQYAGTDNQDVAHYTLDTTALANAAGGDIPSYVANSNNRQVQLALATPLTVGSHKLIVNDGAGYANAIQDYAGYAVQPVSVDFTVAQDTTIPAVVSATVVDQQTVQVKFNKAVQLSEGNNYSANFYWNTNGTAGYTQYPADNPNTVKKIDNQTFNVKFTTNYLKPGTVYFFVTGVTDYNGNTMQDSKTTLTVTADSALTITDITATADNAIKLTFNRTVDNTTATTVSNYTVNDSTGTAQAITSAVRGGANNNEVTLNMTNHLPGGTYTVIIKNVKDTLGNTIADTTKTVAVTDTTPIASFTIAAVNGASNDTIIVTYPEAMATSGTNSIGNKARYMVSKDDGANYTALGSTDTVTVSSDAKTATLTLAAATFNTGDNVKVKINLVADASGNIIPNELVSNNDTPYAAVDSAAGAIDISTLIPKITGTRTIQFTLTRQLKTISAVDFLLRNVTDGTDAVVANASYTNSTTDGTCVVTITTTADLDLTKDYAIKTNATVSATTDILGIKLAANKTTANAVNYIAPNLVSASLVNATTVRLVFDKDLQVPVKTDFTVTVGTSTQTPSNITKVAAKVFDLTITAVDLASTPVVKTIAVPQSEDNVGNKLVANTTGITAANTRPLTISMTKGANAAAIEGDETIVITFDSAVDSTSIDAAWTDPTATLTGKTVILASAAGPADTITIPGVGTITFATETVTAGGTFTNASYKLSSDKKTLTVTLGTAVGGYADLAAADDDVTAAGAGYSATFVLNTGVKNTSGAYYNVGYSLVTGTAIK